MGQSSLRWVARAALGFGSVASAVLLGGQARAQCSPIQSSGILSTPNLAYTNSISSLVSAIETINTLNLTQTSPFSANPLDPGPNQSSGGIWIRGVNAHTTTQSTTTESFYGVPIAKCISKNTQELNGFQIGADLGRVNIGGGGASINFGVTAGYNEINSTMSGSLSAMGPRTSLQDPFFSLYLAYRDHQFFADAQVRKDYIDSRFDDPSSGVFGGRPFATDITSLSFNVGYNYVINNGYFVEPSAGIYLARAVSTSVNLANTPGSVAFDNTVGQIDSRLARASIRFGKDITFGHILLEPFAVASVVNEFGDDVKSFAAARGIRPTLGFVTTRIGTFGQFGAGVAGRLNDSNLLAYIRADYRTGTNVEGYNLTGGIRLQF